MEDKSRFLKVILNYVGEYRKDKNNGHNKFIFIYLANIMEKNRLIIKIMISRLNLKKNLIIEKKVKNLLLRL